MGDHDALFKHVFAVPAHAAGEIAALLPQDVQAAFDLDQLALVPGSFVDAEMAERHADLVFEAPVAGTTGYVYLLFEHQSEPDPLMPFRMLGYLIRLWERVLEDEPGRKTLPPVVSLVLHHGAGGWQAPRSLREMVEGVDRVPGLAELVPDFQLLVDDLVRLDDAALGARPMLPLPRVTLFVLRDARRGEALAEHLRAWARDLEALLSTDPGNGDVAVVMRYISRVVDVEAFDRLRRQIVDVVPAAEDVLGTAAEELIQRGREEGLQRGREEGREEGRVLALRETLERLLTLRFGPVPDELRARIASATVAELEDATGRVLRADSADDVLPPSD